MRRGDQRGSALAPGQLSQAAGLGVLKLDVCGRELGLGLLQFKLTLDALFRPAILAVLLGVAVRDVLLGRAYFARQ